MIVVTAQQTRPTATPPYMCTSCCGDGCPAKGRGFTQSRGRAVCLLSFRSKFSVKVLLREAIATVVILGPVLLPYRRRTVHLFHLSYDLDDKSGLSPTTHTRASVDHTRKFLVSLRDRYQTSSVALPAAGLDASHLTRRKGLASFTTRPAVASSAGG